MGQKDLQPANPTYEPRISNSLYSTFNNIECTAMECMPTRLSPKDTSADAFGLPLGSMLLDLLSVHATLSCLQFLVSMFLGCHWFVLLIRYIFLRIDHTGNAGFLADNNLFPPCAAAIPTKATS